MSRPRPLTPEESVASAIIRAQAQQQLTRGNLSETEQAALELRVEGIMWATPSQITERVAFSREVLRRQAEAEAEARAKQEADAKDRQTPPPEATPPAPKPKRRRGRPAKFPWWVSQVAAA